MIIEGEKSLKLVAILNECKRLCLILDEELNESVSEDESGDAQES